VITGIAAVRLDLVNFFARSGSPPMAALAVIGAASPASSPPAWATDFIDLRYCRIQSPDSFIS
jgi:hypothetical protein